jgi:Domain of unknown function (DUF3854)
MNVAQVLSITTGAGAPLPLSAGDLAVFKKLCIPPSLLAEARIQRVSDKEARNDYGMRFDAIADLSGLLYPYYVPSVSYRVGARVRRDHPEVDIDGKVRNKYISAYGDRKHLYFPPGSAEKLKDASCPVALVEAEKSSLALTAWAERVRMALLPLGMGGCYGWKGRVGREESEPLPDLDFFDGRKVYVLLDANVATNPKVKAARSALCAELPQRKCEVFVCDLPITPDVNGPDDYISVCGDEAMAEVFANARPPKTSEPRNRKGRSEIRDEMQAALDDPRPKVPLPGDNLLLSETAAALGKHFADQALFLRNDEIVTLDNGELRPVSAQTFRTLIERHIICYRKGKNGSFDVNTTMRDDEARGIMASPQFMEKLRRVRRLNSCRLPIFRADGNLELLPEGYDVESQTMTVSTVNYREDTPLSVAVERVDDLFGEFLFADRDRSKAVAVAALVSLFANQLLAEGSLRPCFIVTKNAEGAGATTLVSCAVVSVLGRLPTGVASGEDAEMRKILTAAMREARLVLLFDNQKSRLSSAPLEAFLSSSTWSDRLLCANQTVTGPNHATVFVTANGATISPDMRRRSLVIELHLEVERAEDRQFRRLLDESTLVSMRPEVLAACWSLVSNWDAKGRPQPSRSHSAFPAWAKVVGGVVEAAGWACPLDTANVALAADEDGESMRILVAAMLPGKKYTFPEIVELCRGNEAFIGFLGEPEITKASRSTFGRLLARYDHRLVEQSRFVIEGSGHKRRYYIETVDSAAWSHGQHGIPAELGKISIRENGRKNHADHADHAQGIRHKPDDPSYPSLEADNPLENEICEPEMWL